MRKQTEAEMHDKRLRMIEAAAVVFVRYGFVKTTVGDIAKAAGVHRPVLYNLFPRGKEEIFEAYQLLRAEKAIARYTSELPLLPSLRQKLLFCSEDWCLENFRAAANNPERREEYDIFYPAVKKMYEALSAFYAEVLREAVGSSPLKLPAEQLARLLVFSLRGVRRLPADEEGMRDVVRSVVDVFLTALTPSEHRA